MASAADLERRFGAFEAALGARLREADLAAQVRSSACLLYSFSRTHFHTSFNTARTHRPFTPPFHAALHTSLHTTLHICLHIPPHLSWAALSPCCTGGTLYGHCTRRRWGSIQMDRCISRIFLSIVPYSGRLLSRPQAHTSARQSTCTPRDALKYPFTLLLSDFLDTRIPPWRPPPMRAGRLCPTPVQVGRSRARAARGSAGQARRAPGP